MMCLIEIWIALIFVAILLLTFRDDFHLLVKDLKVALSQPFPYWLYSGVLLCFILPFTIPYTIIGIYKRRK